ncbi:MAG TPA: hypothetical protein DDW84_00715 [Phycisphaerales bacterium]|nr:MAG: hypothetical protein A2Y13_10170 [Planctomycetes bacterium GWC2_45_44]HBG77357.1 hypothetical protein [Phycisphaerales bacterium]HBR19600.1 hypothetical protein [Phycisphaerales bacterium]
MKNIKKIKIKNLKLKIISLCVLCALCGYSFAAEPNDILSKLNNSVKTIKKLSAQIEYVHAQPLFETKTTRAGKIFYVKDVNSSRLRINFLTLKQDDANEQTYREDYVFDGWKFTKIDHQSKSANTEQLAKDKAIEPFELVQDYFPIVGFDEPAKLGEQFEITVIDGNIPQLKLIPKENSRYGKSYKQIDCKLNPANYLPVEFIASTCDDEEITIKLTQIDLKKEIDKTTFDLNIPADYTQK